MKVKVLPSEKYDNNAPRQKWALIAAAFCLFLLWKYNQMEAPDKIVLFIIFSFPCRILAAIWIYNIMAKLNRERRSSAFIAFFFPVCMLILAGLSKKKNLAFTISYTSKQQMEEIRAYAKGFIKEKKYNEAAFVYKYLIAELPFTEQDATTYNELLKKATQPVPEYSVVEDK